MEQLCYAIFYSFSLMIEDTLSTLLRMNDLWLPGKMCRSHLPVTICDEQKKATD